ncbi:MAG: TonB family protein [Deferribacterales bacterium]
MKTAAVKSVAIHVALFTLLYHGTGFTGLKPEPKKVTIDLSAFCEPAPQEAPVMPEPPKPEPVQKKAEPTPAPVKKKTIAKPEPVTKPKYEKVATASPVTAPAPPSYIEPETEYIETEPAAPVQPRQIPAQKDPVPVASAAPVAHKKIFDYDGYRNRLGAKLESSKIYPLMAKRRGIEGLVKLKLKIAANGALLDSEILASSGSDLLDKEAMALVRSVFPVKHDSEDVLYVVVPVMYKLY